MSRKIKRMRGWLPAIFIVAALSGCAASGINAPTASVKPDPSPAFLQATAAAGSNVYNCSELQIAFTVPESWAGRYRVAAGGDSLTVYFSPSQPVDAGAGDGELFTIVRKTPDLDESCFDNAATLEINGVEYIWGEPTDVRYAPEQPEYDTYRAMMRDLPSVRSSVRAAGACPLASYRN